MTRCYERALKGAKELGGVVNTRLTASNDPRLGMILHVDGFDTSGTIGESRAFLACATETFEAVVLPAIATRGTLQLTYPMTFAQQPLSDRDIGIVDDAEHAAAGNHWRDAFETAERGLLLTSLDGPHRRRLIEVAGVAACHLADAPHARSYFALCPPESEARMIAACTTIDLER